MVTGSTVWGHDTGVTEDNIRDFSGNWTGTASIFGSGDDEGIILGVGEYMVSEIAYMGTSNIRINQNVYITGGFPAPMYYRTALTTLSLSTGTWNLYTGTFASENYVQLKVSAGNPLMVSDVNPRYLVDISGNPVFLSGFHTWYNVQDGGDSYPPPEMDWDEYLFALISYGCNWTKLWAMETHRGWSDDTDQWFEPTRYTRTGPGNGNDGRLKVDLDQINPNYISRLVSRCQDLEANQIYFVIQLFQGWQIEQNKGGTGDPTTYHPYLSANNVDAIDGDDNNDGDLLETHYISGSASNNVLLYQQTLVEEIIDSTYGFDYLVGWEISNEDTGENANTLWQYEMINYINNYQSALSKQHLVMMTKQYPNESDAVLDVSGADLVSYSTTKADAVHAGTDPISMYDTDHTVGLASEYDIDWLWEALCNGHGGSWFMDAWDGALYGSDWRNNAGYIYIRNNLGYLNTLVGLLNDLLGMTPQPALCSTGYCLAKDHATAAEYVCFNVNGAASFTLDLTNATGTLNVRWLKCSDGTLDTDDTVSGGAERTLTNPSGFGVSVAYVYHLTNA